MTNCRVEFEMISDELITFGLTWLANNGLTIVVLLYALVPLVAIAAMAYVLVTTNRRGK